MHLVLLKEATEPVAQECFCDWCEKTILEGERVWKVTLQDGDNVFTIDVCCECSVAGPLEKLVN